MLSRRKLEKYMKIRSRYQHKKMQKKQDKNGQKSKIAETVKRR